MASTPVISIIDDDVSYREATERFIRSLGYIVVTFASAEDYLRSGRARDTACLISDVMMPGMDGIELQQRLIADGHRTPIIFMTAHPREHVRRCALEAGALGVLNKPFNDDTLIHHIARALRADGRGLGQ